MTRLQFIILSVVSGLLVILLGGNFLLLRMTQNAERDFGMARSEILQARQNQAIFQRLVAATAQASEKDPALRELLKKYGLKVTLNVDGKQRKLP